LLKKEIFIVFALGENVSKIKPIIVKKMQVLL